MDLTYGYPTLQNSCLSPYPIAEALPRFQSRRTFWQVPQFGFARCKEVTAGLQVRSGHDNASAGADSEIGSREEELEGFGVCFVLRGMRCYTRLRACLTFMAASRYPALTE